MQPIERRLGGALLPLLALLATSAVASAQSMSAADEPAEYYPTIQQAVHAYEQGHWPEAYAWFQQAHQLSPSARTLRGLALAAYKLRRYAESERHLQAALASTIKPLTEEQRAELEQVLQWARRYIGSVQLNLQPQNARAWIDGVEAPSTSLALDMGGHELTVRAPGHVTQHQTIVVDGARQSQVNVFLVPLDVNPARVDRTQKREAASRSSSLLESPWLWAAVGVVATGAVVFVATREGDVRQTPPYAGGAGIFMGPTQ